MIGGARITLHDVGCHLTHKACVDAGLRSQQEVVVPALAIEKLTEPRVDVDAWGHPGLPHLRLDFTVTDPRTEHFSSAHREIAGAAAKAEGAKAEKYGTPIGGVGVTGLALELSGRFGPGLDSLLRRLAGYRRALQSAAGREAGRPLQTWRLAFSLALARYAASAILSATDAVPVGIAAARRVCQPLHRPHWSGRKPQQPLHQCAGLEQCAGRATGPPARDVAAPASR